MQPDKLPRIDQGAWTRFIEYGDDPGFLDAWLTLLCQITPGAEKGWLFVEESDALALYAVHGGEAGAEAPVDPALEAAIAEAVETENGAAHPDENSETRWLVAFPAIAEGRVVAVTALEIQAPDEATPAAAFHQLKWGLGWVLDWLRRQESEAPDARQAAPPPTAPPPARDVAAAFQLFANVVEAPRFQEAAETLATRLADLMRLDRAAIGLRAAGRTRVIAVSHAAHSERRMEEMRRIEAAMDEALDQRAAICWPVPPGKGEAGGTLVTRAHQELASAAGGGGESGARAAASAPLPASPLDRRETAGVLTIEKAGGVSAEERAFFEAAARLSGAVLMEKRLADRPWTARAFDSASGLLRMVLGPRRPLLKLGLGLGALALAAAAFLPVDFVIRAPAELEPRRLRVVSAPFDGYLAAAEKRAGDAVAKGEALARLDEADLVLEQTALIADRNRTAVLFEEATAKYDQAEAKIQRARLAQYEARLKLVETRLTRATIVSPIDGVVVSGDLSRSVGEPMKTGRELFEIAPEAAYRLVLKIDERDIAYVEVGRKGRAVLAALPDETLVYSVEKITPVLEVRDGRNYYRVEAALERQSSGFRPGLEGRARLDGGSAPSLWIWTRNLTGWVRLKLWAYWP